MASVTEWKTGTTGYHFNGSICCLCFLIGTLGNIVSFLYFKSKKRDISNVIYMLITANDIVISITVLPVGISFLSQGKPGLIFGNKYGCVAWQGVWEMAISLSVFLVLCLCITRTISLLTPFRRQKIKYLAVAVVMYVGINLIKWAILNSFSGIYVLFTPSHSRCIMSVKDPDRKSEIKTVSALQNISFTAPALVVSISCAISVIVILTRRNRNVQQRELQQSRNRATVTLLLFALLYGVCNIPFAVDNVFVTYCLGINDWQIYYDLLKFDKHLYYWNAMATLLLAANSAANPILYFWRMPALREYIMSGIRRMLGQNREVRRPAIQQAEPRTCNAVAKRINFTGRNIKDEE